MTRLFANRTFASVGRRIIGLARRSARRRKKDAALDLGGGTGLRSKNHFVGAKGSLLLRKRSL